MDINALIAKKSVEYGRLKETKLQEAVKWCADPSNMGAAGFVMAASIFSGAGLASLASAASHTPLYVPMAGISLGIMAIAPAMMGLIGVGAYGRTKESAADEMVMHKFPALLGKVASKYGSEVATEASLRSVVEMNPVKRLFTVDREVRQAAAMYQAISVYSEYGGHKLRRAFDEVSSGAAPRKSAGLSI